MGNFVVQTRSVIKEARGKNGGAAATTIRFLIIINAFRHLVENVAPVELSFFSAEEAARSGYKRGLFLILPGKKEEGP